MPDRLSPRETEILRLIAAGKTTKEISAQLSIAESTVNWHVGNVLSKLGAASRAGAVATALRGDLLNSADPRVGPGAAGRGRWAQRAPRFAGAFLLIVLVLVAGFATAATVVGTININVDDLGPGTTAGPRATDVATPPATVSTAPLSSISPGSATPQVQNQSAAPPPASPAAPIPAPALATASLPAAPAVPPLAPSLVPPPIPTVVPVPTTVPPLPTPSLPLPPVPTPSLPLPPLPTPPPLP